MIDATVSLEAKPTPRAIWSPLPKQPRQARCRQNLAHSETRRTFYWIAEQSGPICQECVNVRNTRMALAGQEAGNSGNEMKAGKSGKSQHSIGAPTVIPPQSAQEFIEAYERGALSKYYPRSLEAIGRKAASGSVEAFKALVKTAVEPRRPQAGKGSFRIEPALQRAIQTLYSGNGTQGTDKAISIKAEKTTLQIEAKSAGEDTKESNPVELPEHVKQAPA